jgi:RNA polymerase sigma factor (sigma-70 family)
VTTHTSAADVVPRESVSEQQSALCRAHYRKLTGFAYSLVGDEQIAADIAQEAFVRLFARWTGVRHPAAYLYLVATNLARRQWRQRQREEAALARAYDGEPALPAYDPSLRDALARLPKRQRQVLVLHYLADLSVDVVATHLQLAPGTVKRLLHEARAGLASALEDSR